MAHAPAATTSSRTPRREDAAAANAFEREYEEDHSWELLREDEHGNLIPLVRLCSTALAAWQQRPPQPAWVPPKCTSAAHPSAAP